MNFANGPERISTDWSASKFYRVTTFPTLSHRAHWPAVSTTSVFQGLRKAEHARYAIESVYLPPRGLLGVAGQKHIPCEQRPYHCAKFDDCVPCNLMHWHKCLKPLSLQVAASNLMAVRLKLHDLPWGCVRRRNVIYCVSNICIGFFLLSAKWIIIK